MRTIRKLAGGAIITLALTGLAGPAWAHEGDSVRCDAPADTDGVGIIEGAAYPATDDAGVIPLVDDGDEAEPAVARARIMIIVGGGWDA
jgi:hypothetical protein